MGLTHQSTRGGEREVTASVVILQGLARDGGPLMSSCIPQPDAPLEKLASMTYQEATYEIVKLFLIGYAEEELRDCIVRAYDSKFDIEEIASLTKADGAYYLELYHGNTIVSKNMALSIPPHSTTITARKNHADREIAILTVTSGDTGKVATTGFADVPGIRIIIFYPKDGVSKAQEFQMRTQKGDNISVVTIHGNFGDAQTGVKKMFGDKDLEAELTGKGFQSPSANSTSIGRLVPQIVYYAYAYAKLLEVGGIERGENINVVVPTGNFGNTLAAYFAKHTGLPVKTLVCASNDNKVLYDFFTIGVYDRKGEFILTNSPSMDTLISSDLERLIYMSTGCGALISGNLMWGPSQEGRYEVTPEMRAFISDFVGDSATQEQNAATIKKPFDDTGYLVGTHIGVATSVHGDYRKEGGDNTKTVIAPTASPYKFSHSVVEATVGREGLEGKDEFEIVDAPGALSDAAVLQAVEEIRHAAARYNRECGADDMKNEVEDILGIS